MLHTDKTAPLPPPPPVAPPPPPPAMICDAENWANTAIEELVEQNPDCVLILVIGNKNLEREIEEFTGALIKGRYRKRRSLEALHHQAKSALEDEVCEMADAIGLDDYRIESRLVGRKDAPKVEITIVTREPVDAETVMEDMTELLDAYFASR